MKLAELAEALNVPPRQIRYMIAEGILPGASETGRGAEGFGEAHLALGRRYLLLHEKGFPPAAIKLLMAGAAAMPLVEAGPVVLSVDPGADPSAIDVEATLAAIETALRRYAQS